MHVILMKTTNKIALIYIFSVMMASCVDNKIVLKTINGQVAGQNIENRHVDFGQLPFDWDTLYIFNDTYSKSEIEKLVKNTMHYDMCDPGIHLLFLRGNELVYEEHWLETECYDSHFERNDANFVLTSKNKLYLSDSKK